MLVSGSRTSTPASLDIQNGIPLMPNLTQMVSSEMVNRSPGAAANTKQCHDIISLDDGADYCLPRSVVERVQFCRVCLFSGVAALFIFTVGVMHVPSLD